MALLILFIWMAFCANQDASGRKVSNGLSLGGVAFALSYLLLTGHSWLGYPAGQALWALGLTLVLTLPGYAMGKLGAGDVKLLMALALATDELHLLGTFVGAGVTSLGWLMMRQKLWPHLSQRLRRRYSNMGPETSNKQPFVPFLLAGFMLTALFIIQMNCHLTLCT